MRKAIPGGLSLEEALRVAAVMPVPVDVVMSCMLDRPSDAIFHHAFDHGLASLPPAKRSGALASTTGHIAESVVSVLLKDLGFFVVWHFTGSGAHGVDLVELSPDARHVLAIEVKGTLRPHYWPRLTKGELTQFSAAWLDKDDNPGMAEWSLGSADVFGAVVLVNFADRLWKAAVTAEFQLFLPIASTDELAELSQLAS